MAVFEVEQQRADPVGRHARDVKPGDFSTAAQTTALRVRRLFYSSLLRRIPGNFT